MEASGFYITREGWTAGYSGDPWLKGAENCRLSLVVGRWSLAKSRSLRSFIWKRAKRAYGVAKKRRHVARLAQLPHSANPASLAMTGLNFTGRLRGSRRLWRLP